MMTTQRRGRKNISENVRVLHNTLVNILNEEDRAYFIRSLNQYQKDRDINVLVASLKSVLDSPRKREVYPLLREIIPSGDKRYFERTWYAGSRPQSLHSSKEWTMTRSRSNSQPLEPLRRSNLHSSLPGNLDKYDSGIDISNLRNGAYHRTAPQKYPIRRLYIKRSPGTGFGFSMRGGSEHGVGLYVSSVDENSLAEYEGLLPGDHILSINEILFDGLTHNQAVKIIRNNKKLNMVVRSVGCIPNTFVAEATYKWIDTSGQRVSPPPNVDSNGREMSIEGIHRSDLRLLGDDDERKVNIFVEDGDKLGLRIRGGSEYGLGIYIAGVDPNSAADKAGLKCGDQIMDVNGVSFLNISHDDAVKALKSAKNMMVTMKDVGRLPFAKTTTDKTKWAKGKLPHSTLQSDTESIYTSAQIHAHPDDRRNTTTGINTRFEKRPEDSKFRQSIAGSQLMYNGTGPSPKNLTEEQARQTLNENEFGTLTYYLEEYRRGYITVDSFVLALFSLLNTPAKLSLLTEIRGSILPKDIDRFDDLVLKKEIEAIKTRNMTITDDVQSIHSYSSSISSYSGKSSSSRSSAKISIGGLDSRPITPPHIPEMLPSNKPLDDKTLINGIENDTMCLPNISLNDSQDSAMSELLPISSSTPRRQTDQRLMTNGEITNYHLTGDNNRYEHVDLNQTKSKQRKYAENHTKSNEKTKQLSEDATCFKTLSSGFPEESAKQEKRGFSLFGHSKFKGSYSPIKQYEDKSIVRQEKTIDADEDKERSNTGKPTVNDSLVDKQNHKTILEDKPNKVLSPTTEDFLSANSAKNRVYKPTIGSKLSAFAPPKPPRSFLLSGDNTATIGEENEYVEVDVDATRKRDIVKASVYPINEMTPPKPQPYHTYVKEQITKTHESPNFKIMQVKDDTKVDSKGMEDSDVQVIENEQPSVSLNTAISIPGTANNATVDENHNSLECRGTDFSPTDEKVVGIESLTRQKDVGRLEKATTEKVHIDQKSGMFLALEETPSTRSGFERRTCWEDEEDGSSGDPTEPNKQGKQLSEESSHDATYFRKRELSKPVNLQRAQNIKPLNGQLQTDKKTVLHEQSQESKTPSEQIYTNKTPYKQSKDNKPINIQPNNINTSLQHQKIKVEKPSNNKLLIESGQNVVNTRYQPGVSIDANEKAVTIVTNHDENTNDISEESPSRSLVRNMIDVYNHMDQRCQAKDTVTNSNQKYSNRKSWDGVHNVDERSRLSSQDKKKNLKSSSDSNLMNLPKDQKKEIQVKMRASEELLDLRQAVKSRESSASSSPRQSIDDILHTLRHHDQQRGSYEVKIEKNDEGLGLSLEGGCDTLPQSRVKIKSVKEGPYAACMTGKLKPGQELCQINEILIKDMTNAMAVLTLRHEYADTENKVLTLVVKNP